MTTELFESSIHSLPLIHRGKVRDIYAVDAQHLLIVTTDRLSAFDVILPDPIPQKGKVLTDISLFWFHFFSDIIPNQLVHLTAQEVLTSEEYQQVEGQAIVVKKLQALPIEAIVRGYLIGSGWKDYQQTGQVCGIHLPPKLQLADQLPQIIYTPSSKAAVGEHDENINFETTVTLVGSRIAKQIKEVSIRIYQQAAKYAKQRGIIIADTKFEFGLDNSGQLTLIDEVLTPDSSRFWAADSYHPGSSPHSFDKQYIRDYLEQLHWNKTPPAPKLPTEIINNTSKKYQQAYQILTHTT